MTMFPATQETILRLFNMELRNHVRKVSNTANVNVQLVFIQKTVRGLIRDRAKAMMNR
jgi:dynactin complex subunit